MLPSQNFKLAAMDLYANWRLGKRACVLGMLPSGAPQILEKNMLPRINFQDVLPVDFW